MDAYIDAMKKYGVFSGRTSRRDFWTFILIHYGIIVGSFIVSRITEYTILEYPVIGFSVLY